MLSNRELLPRDYHYIIASTSTSGLNDRFLHVVVIHGEEFIRLERIPGKDFDKHHAMIAERRTFFNRQLALDTLIERSAVSHDSITCVVTNILYYFMCIMDC